MQHPCISLSHQNDNLLWNFCDGCVQMFVVFIFLSCNIRIVFSLNVQLEMKWKLDVVHTIRYTVYADTPHCLTVNGFVYLPVFTEVPIESQQVYCTAVCYLNEKKTGPQMWFFYDISMHTLTHLTALIHDNPRMEHNTVIAYKYTFWSNNCDMWLIHQLLFSLLTMLDYSLHHYPSSQFHAVLSIWPSDTAVGIIIYSK